MANRFGAAFRRRERWPAEVLTTGIGEIDVRLSGFPRGAITEVHGIASSGRTSLLVAALAVATRQEETCALIDAGDTFDPASAANALVDFERLLWIRCGGSLELAFKATDLLLQSGGFGLVALSMSEVAERYARRIIPSWWFRLRCTIESTATTLVVVTPASCVRSCAAAIWEIENERAVWPSALNVAFETSNVGKEEYEKDQTKSAQLSLVPESARPVRNNPSRPAHTVLLRGAEVRIAGEKPAFWAGGPARFSVRAKL